MLNAFWWLLTVEAIGLAAFPLAYYLFPRLADRGYSISKPLGILLIGYVSWMLSLLHVLPSVRLSLIGLLLLMGGLSSWFVWQRRDEFKAFIIRERMTIIAVESIFLVFFIGWTIFRATDPAINHTEQPMDFAFLNASIQNTTGQPEDPWLRGETISYYYFGYWMMGGVSQLSGVPSNFSFNLSLALIPAMGAMGIFGLIFSMVRSEARRMRYAVLGGVAAAILLGVVSNLEGVLEFMRANDIASQAFWDWIRIDGLDGSAPPPADSWTPSEFWWWFRSTRVINTFDGIQGLDYTIQEFPFFSFILGDLHPHVMSIPFAILFLTIGWNFLRMPMHVWRERNVQRYALILAMALTLGGLAFTNMWDLPTYSAIFLGLAVMKTYHANGGGVIAMTKGVVLIGAVVIGLAILLYLPYYISFNSSVSGIQPVMAATTRPIHLFIIWGLLLVAVVPFILRAFWETRIGGDWRRLTLFSLAVVVVPFLAWAVLHLNNGGGISDLIGRFFLILPFAALISAAIYSALWFVREDGPSGKPFALMLAAFGLLLIMGVELLFVDDSFPAPNERMNTVFKLYYQAWLLLAASGGFAIYYWRSMRISLSGWRHSLTTVWAGVFVILLVGSLYYPPAAAVSKGELALKDATLDGLAFVKRNRNGEFEAINYIKGNVDSGSAIVEAVGEWFDAGLISRSTGIPTIFNWPGHESQWRGDADSFAGREQDVSDIYQTQDIELARNLLAKYDVDYVYIGPRERAKYYADGEDGLSKFSDFMELVFNEGDVVLYRLVQ